MWKRVSGVAAVLVPVLCACSGAQDSGPPDIALVVANAELNFSIEMAEGYQAGVARVGGVNATVTGPGIVDGSQQLEMFEELVSRADDGISIFTLTPEILAEPIAEAVNDGVPIIAVDNPPPAGSEVTLFIGNDNRELGRMLADLAIAELPAGTTGKIVIGSPDPGAKVLELRAKGIRERIEQRLPGAAVLGPFDTAQDTSANEAAWRALVKANPDAVAFLGTGDADGWNLSSIRAQAGGRWVAGAFDLDARSLAAVKAGDLVLVSPEHFVKGAVAGRLQAEHAKSGAALPSGWLYIPGLPVNQENIDAVRARQHSPETTAREVTPRIDQILTDTSYLRSLAEVG